MGSAQEQEARYTMHYLTTLMLISLALYGTSAQDDFFGHRSRLFGRRQSNVHRHPTSQKQDLPVEAPTIKPVSVSELVHDVVEPVGLEEDPNVQFITDVECPEKEGLQVYPNPESCNSFYKCANGTLTLETCGNGLLFNIGTALAGATDNHCSYIWQTNCGERKNDTTPISSQGCEYQFGIFAKGPGCYDSYTKCAHGIPTKVTCRLGLAYDYRIHACNWPDLMVKSAGCDPSALLGGFQCPSEAELSPLARRYYPFPRFAIPNEPTLYAICVNGLPRLNSCGAGSRFSQETLSCMEVDY